MAKKPTIKQLEERINLITSQLNFATRMLESVGVAFSSYVRFEGKEEDFRKYLESSKNLTKLSKEENEARKRGNITETKDVSAKEIRKEVNGKEQNKVEN